MIILKENIDYQIYLVFQAVICLLIFAICGFSPGDQINPECYLDESGSLDVVGTL